MVNDSYLPHQSQLVYHNQQSVCLCVFFYRGHPVVLIMTIILHINQSFNTTFSVHLITIDI